MKTCFSTSPSARASGLLSRRQLLTRLGAAAVSYATRAALGASSPRETHGLGVCSICYALRWPEIDRNRGSIEQALEFAEHCRALGAAGVQTTIRTEPEYVRALREKVEQSNLFLEGQVSLPRTDSDLDRFDAAVHAAREAGASVLRTACLSGRRYETFQDAQAFRDFAKQSARSLGLAEPIARKHQVKLAVENHKDWRVPDLLQLMDQISSEWVGICVDTGNSIALLEDPLTVVEAYAPYALATHLKDMGVQEFEKGFLLAEVPLGEGFLDIPAIVATLRRHRPGLRFNLEMIARDPLKIPCLTRGYWATFENLPGRFLADTLAMVRSNASKKPLPSVSGLSSADKLEVEDQLVRRSLAYARQQLHL